MGDLCRRTWTRRRRPSKRLIVARITTTAASGKCREEEEPGNVHKIHKIQNGFHTLVHSCQCSRLHSDGEIRRDLFSFFETEQECRDLFSYFETEQECERFPLTDLPSLVGRGARVHPAVSQRDIHNGQLLMIMVMTMTMIMVRMMMMRALLTIV